MKLIINNNEIPEENIKYDINNQTVYASIGRTLLNSLSNKILLNHIADFMAIKPGDIIKVDGIEGEVTAIGTPFLNYDCAEPGWEVETTNGYVSIYNDMSIVHHTDNVPIWSEIRCDYYDDIDGCWCIDALETDCDEEEKVIAKVYDTGKTSYIEYLDKRAKTDKYAQECIKEVISRIQTLDKNSNDVERE